MPSSVAALSERVRNKCTTTLCFTAHRAAHLLARCTIPRSTDQRARDAGRQLREDGVVQLGADEPRRRFVESDYEAGMRLAWDRNEGTWRDPAVGGTYKVFLADVCERWPNVLTLLDGKVGAALRSYYGAHFQITYVEAYRTFPAVGTLPKSWLWHFDAVAPSVLKAMVYLNGASSDTGALRVLPHPQTRELKRLGYRSRADSSRFTDAFESRQVPMAGEAGDSVIIDNVVLHKATAPVRGYRDVVCFQVMPSTVPEPVARHRTGASRSYRPSTPQFPPVPRVFVPRFRETRGLE